MSGVADQGAATAVDDRWLLPIEGLVSGILTYFTSRVLPAGLGRGAFLIIGLVFGATIAAHARLFRGVCSTFRLIGFVAACGVAYLVSVYATVWSPLRPQFLNFSGTGSAAIDSSPFFTGGALGAAIVCAGVFLFLAPPKNAMRFLLQGVCISLACGLLGVLGWSLGEQLSSLQWLPGRPNDRNFLALYTIWQAGAITLLGLFLLPRRLPAGSVPRPDVAT